MIEELQLLNHYLKSGDPNYLLVNGIDPNYFIAMNEVARWIESYKASFGGGLPTVDTVTKNFEDFRDIQELDSPKYLIDTIKENKAYIEFKPVLTSGATLVAEGSTIEAMWKMRNKIDELLKEYNLTTDKYDWVKDAVGRYEEYLKKHGVEGLVGIDTGFEGMNNLTGGWQDDDLILLTARLGEGKSLLSIYFAYRAWLSQVKKKCNRPVVFISTEMPKLEVSYRLDTLRGHFSNRALNRGKLTNPDLYMEYLTELTSKDTPFLIYTTEENGGRNFTTKDIENIYETMKPSLVVIDQVYDISDGSNEPDIRRRIVNASNEIRRINLSAKVPTILVAQAGRGSAKDSKKDPNATPEIHQIQESDNPAQKATIVLALRQLDGSMFKYTVRKNRGGEKNVDIFVRANIDTGMWDELDEMTAVF